jgi:cell division protein FtsW
LTAVLLIAVFAFPEINGARRWIRMGPFSIQPSEIAKIALPIFLAYFLTRNEDRVGEIKSTVIPAVGALVLLGGLVFIEPDLGTTIVLCAIFSAVYFAAGAKILHIATLAGAMVVMDLGAVLLAPWRVERLMAFLDHIAHSDDAGYQVVQSLYAIGSGGVFGEGFAK